MRTPSLPWKRAARSAAASVQPATERGVAVTTMVDVDGVSLRVTTAGIETRKSGEAVIVFENGGGLPPETWDPILPAVPSQLRLRHLPEWVHPPGEFIVATRAGHFVHRDEPQLVIAVRRLIDPR